MSDELKEKPEASAASIDLLNARSATIKGIVKELGGDEVDKLEDTTAHAIGQMTVAAVKDAAGMGFDAGFKAAFND